MNRKRLNIWTGKVIINWNHYKSVQLLQFIQLFVNDIIKIFSFCPFSPWNTSQMHFKRSIVIKKLDSLNPWPPKISPLTFLRLFNYLLGWLLPCKFCTCWQLPSLDLSLAACHSHKQKQWLWKNMRQLDSIFLPGK